MTKTRTEQHLESMNLNEIHLLMNCLNSPFVVEAMRIYHTLPAISKAYFINRAEKRQEVLVAQGEK